MKRILTILGVAGSLAVLYYSLQAQESFKTLDNIRVENNTVIMTLSGETKFNIFKISNPPRLVIEFTNTEHDVKSKEIEVNGKLIKKIRSAQFENEPTKIARVVVELNQMVEYDLKGNSSEVTLTLNPENAAPNDNTVIANSASVTPPEDDTVIATPVEESKDAQTLASATPKPADKVKKPAPKPAAPAKKTATKKTTTTEKSKRAILPKTLVTLDFEEAEIKDVLRILSIKSGINLIHGDEVSGIITLHLENVPFDKAFETILALKGLVSQEQGSNILRITTTQKVTEERNQSVTFTKIFPLNYAKAEDVKGNLDAIRSAEGRRGASSIDLRTNSIIITDTPEGLSSAEGIISELDKQPYQVIIECKIVEVSLTDDLDLGIQWQIATDISDSIKVGQTSGAEQAFGTQPSDTSNKTVVPPVGGGTGVTFPGASASGQLSAISFGIVTNNSYITGMLTALAQKGLSKLLSTPKVTTINNKQARILIGQRIPYTTTTVTATGSTQATQFLDVGIKLSVTPTINADEKVTLQVRPEVSLFVRADAAGPVVGTREADTTVMVNNGETVVIGGLITEEDRKLGTQVPLLGDLPIIGHLFKRDYSSKQRTELLVFLTPQIIKN
ncbi:MAG: type IV pilus secretin PilQ [Elusimicrobiota bacterium]